MAVLACHAVLAAEPFRFGYRRDEEANEDLNVVELEVTGRQFQVQIYCSPL